MCLRYPLAVLLQNESQQLKEYDQDKIVSYYEALWHINSHLAKNPVIAGTFVNNQLRMGMGIPPNLAADLLAKNQPKGSTLNSPAANIVVKSLSNTHKDSLKS